MHVAWPTLTPPAGGAVCEAVVPAAMASEPSPPAPPPSRTAARRGARGAPKHAAPAAAAQSLCTRIAGSKALWAVAVVAAVWAIVELSLQNEHDDRWVTTGEGGVATTAAMLRQRHYEQAIAELSSDNATVMAKHSAAMDAAGLHSYVADVRGWSGLRPDHTPHPGSSGNEGVYPKGTETVLAEGHWDKFRPAWQDENYVLFIAEAHHLLYGTPWADGADLFNHLVREGLQPHHRVLDLPCGSGRLGIKLAAYLRPDRYYGMDADEFSVAAFLQYEIPVNGLVYKRPRVLVGEHFDIERFATAWPAEGSDTQVDYTGERGDARHSALARARMLHGARAMAASDDLKFDRIVSIAGINHFEKDTLTACLSAWKRHLADGGEMRVSHITALDNIGEDKTRYLAKLGLRLVRTYTMATTFLTSPGGDYHFGIITHL